MSNDRYATIALVIATAASLFLAVADLVTARWGDFGRDIVVVLGFGALLLFFRQRPRGQQQS